MSTRPPPTDDEVLSWGVRCTVEQAAWALGMGRNQAYAALAEGRFPVPTYAVEQAGGRVQTWVPTSHIRRLLGIDENNRNPNVPRDHAARDAHARPVPGDPNHSPESVKAEPSSSALTDDGSTPPERNGSSGQSIRRLRSA